MQTDSKGQTGLRRRIMDETRHLLIADGYQNLSMRKIARAIGYSATSIYLHFQNKDALFHALIDEGMELMYGRLNAVVHAHPDDPVTALRKLCRAYIDFGLENPEYYAIMFQLRPEQMARYPAEKYRRARRNLDLITTTLTLGAEQAVLVVPDPPTCTSAVWASLHGAVSLLIARRVDVKIDANALVDAVVDQVVQCYIAIPAAPPS